MAKKHRRMNSKLKMIMMRLAKDAEKDGKGKVDS